MDDTTASSTKRPRPSDDDDESHLSGESPAISSLELKRLRRVSAEDYLFNILDEDDSTESPEMDDGLASVMHSLEQEIRSGNGNGSESERTGTAPDGDKAASAEQLGYLLEASDDELGIPPAAESPAPLAGDVVDLTGPDVAEPPAMYGQMWGFDDDIGFGLDFGFRPETADDGFGFGSVGYDDVGLFDHSEPSDRTWRTMPAA